MTHFALLAALVVAPPQDSGAFIVRMGTDTLVVERFTRTGSRIDGEYLARSPRTVLRRWTATLAPDGSVRTFEMTSTSPAEPGRGAVRATLEFSGDSVTSRQGAGDSVQTRRVAAPQGTLPYLGNSWTLLEQAVRRARTRGSAPVTQPMIGPGDDEPLQIGVAPGADSVVVSIFGNPNVARVDATGRILSVRGFGQVTVERMARLDLPALVTTFANRPLGALSPRDTARGEVGGAHLTVDYSRPARRGRTIFGGIVPWGQVWRTGANTATTLITDAAVVIGGAAIPKGQYTLYTIPTPTGWTLIINRAVGQSGTEHDPAQDLVRIPMTIESLPESVERLTIGIDARGSGSALSIAWDRTRAWIPVAAQ